ncbi:helix-turn-helix transcriptional regulator [Silvimonas amylolytica]|uniref:Transcriptional regulator DauR n=1 Tax=Silvimonas amylolytica TaxID=449663 RepID=A0ABQ2PHR1_9NEIS|nr:PAS domain-containing protein [Silvimonas amylolytica]GGP25153.1 transcriptional regulator DauR [Silvimonas amylolytica]
MTQKKNATSKTLLLERYRHVADGIATLFFPYAEVVIHHLEDQCIAYLANNLSKRQIGDDSALEEMRQGDAERIMGPYEKLNWDGRRMRSVSMVLFDDEQIAIGVMCINFNIAVFDDMQAALSLFIKGAGVIAQPAALFKDDWQERINTFMHGWLAERQLSLNTLSRNHRQALVEALYEEGAFQRKSAADYVANVLGMGRATVYKHVKKLKESD